MNIKDEHFFVESWGSRQECTPIQKRDGVRRTTQRRTGQNPSKTRTLHFNGPIIRQNEAYRAILWTLETTSGITFLLQVL